MSDSPREILASGAAELGIFLSDQAIDQFETLTTLLLEWNQKFNLTRITDPTEIAVKHYMDSLSLLSFVRLKKGASVIDVGTGAGLPGIPLKIVLPDIRLALLDSVKKKLAFAEAAAQELGMSDVKFIHARAEDAGRDAALRERFDLSVSRAVARLALLCELCLPFCRIGGRFVAYKGPDAEAEIDEAAKALKVMGGKVEAVHKFTLPNSDSSRTLVVIKKVHRTMPGYPRKAGIPEKSPLI